jgi:hypothetical protein
MELNELHDNVPTLFLYEYPHMEGTPIGLLEPDAEMLQHPHLIAHWRECQCLLAVAHEECGVDLVGGVYKHYVDDAKRFIHVLVSCDDAEHIYIKRDDVANVLLNVGSQYFLQDHEELWVDWLDVAMMFQYESDYALPLLVDSLTRRFMPESDKRGTFFRLCHMLYICIERNKRKDRQALRRAFHKALPQLLPSVTVAKKKPGYASKNGHADFFLERQGQLMPTQLLTDPVSQPCVDALRKAIRGYQAETGYFFAPGIAEGVVLDDNMIFIHFA